jgi:tetratricopeptide (TPR) repeat protein
MAITPRTIFTSPASATVATISLLAFSAVGTLAYKVAQQNTPDAQRVYQYQATESCNGIREVLGQNKSDWSETDWMVYSSCFEQKNNSRMAAKVAAQGLRYHPASEPLYNLKGYHEIVLGDHAEAVDTLEKGLRSVGNPSSGILENNLAWAGLWVPREMDRDRARVLYKRSLRRNAGSCETIHTGLWVEYAIARESRGVEKYHALKNFLNLRNQYEPCQNRIESGDWKTLVEVVGVTVLFQDVDENLNVPHTVATSNSEQDGTEELHRVTQQLREDYRGVSIDALCREAMPLANTHHLCADSVSEAVHTLKKKEAQFDRIDRNQRHDIHIIRSAGDGSGGCVRTK